VTVRSLLWRVREHGRFELRRFLASTVVLGAGLLALCSVAPAEEIEIHSELRTAVFEGRLYTLALDQLLPDAERSAISSDPSLDYLFVLGPGDDAAGHWVGALDGMRSSKEDALCREVEVTFKRGAPVRQFTSARELLKAEKRGEITVAPTGRVHLYTVLGRLERWPGVTPVLSLRP
jgi:hypothetical protein